MVAELKEAANELRKMKLPPVLVPWGHQGCF